MIWSRCFWISPAARGARHERRGAACLGADVSAFGALPAFLAARAGAYVLARLANAGVGLCDRLARWREAQRLALGITRDETIPDLTESEIKDIKGRHKPSGIL